MPTNICDSEVQTEKERATLQRRNLFLLDTYCLPRAMLGALVAQEPPVAYKSGAVISLFTEEETEAQKHREVSCLAPASDLECGD